MVTPTAVRAVDRHPSTGLQLVKPGLKFAEPQPRLMPRAGFVLDADARIISTVFYGPTYGFCADGTAAGRPFSDLIEQPNTSTLKMLLNRALDGSPASVAVRFKGSATDCACSQLYLFGEGSFVHILWLEDEDRPESKRQEPVEASTDNALFARLFQAYLQLEENNRRKMAILASSTHEVKTPLAIMSGAAELLMSEKLGALNEKQLEMAALVQENCNRLLNTVTSFLNYAAAESGKLSVHSAYVRLDEVLGEAVAYWRNVAKSGGVAMDSIVIGDLPSVPCDREKVLTIINTLCDNAIKYTPNGGSVTITAESYFWDRRTILGERAEERRKANQCKRNSVRVTVSDTGPGIDPEFHNEIFGAFFRAPQNKRRSGVGLGLAIARDLVSAHGGKIWVDSHPGGGSKFHFLLPL